MNVTFMIGNGFDLNLDLKTSYLDFTKEYIKEAENDTTAIKLFKDKLKEDFVNGNWSDLELYLGEFSCYLENCQQLLECVEDISEKLQYYLEQVESDFLSKTKTNRYSLRLNQSNVRTYFSSFSFKDTQALELNYLNFNYTKTLDLCYPENSRYSNDKFRSNIPIHVNEKLSDGVILGLDNKYQIKNKEILENSTDLELIRVLKPRINASLNLERYNHCKKLLDNADLIYIFGMSFGETDREWWELVKKNIKTLNKRLVISHHNPNYKKSNSKLKQLHAKQEVLSKFNEGVGENYFPSNFLENTTIHQNTSIFDYLSEVAQNLKKEEEIFSIT